MDLMLDPDFRPCRNERCKLERLHAEHEDTVGKRGSQLRFCPLCKSSLCKLPRKRARCSNPVCNWRGTTTSKPEKQEHQINA